MDGYRDLDPREPTYDAIDEDELEEMLDDLISEYSEDVFSMLVRKWNGRRWEHEEAARAERLALNRARRTR